VSIIFLHVSAEAVGNRVACGSALQAMFSWQGNEDYQCGSATFPRLWVAGGVAAVGMGVAFWGEDRGRLLAVVSSRAALPSRGSAPTVTGGAVSTSGVLA
jgi:hypothetical protein